MLSPEMNNVLEHYNRGLELYKKMQFQDAKNEFEKAVEIMPDDGPSKLYVERCQMFIENPPPSDWDGVFTMTSK